MKHFVDLTKCVFSTAFNFFQTIKTLWGEIEQKNEIIQKLSAEKEELAADLQKKEQEVKIKADAVSEKVNFLSY